MKLRHQNIKIFGKQSNSTCAINTEGPLNLPNRLCYNRESPFQKVLLKEGESYPDWYKTGGRTLSLIRKSSDVKTVKTLLDESGYEDELNFKLGDTSTEPGNLRTLKPNMFSDTLFKSFMITQKDYQSGSFDRFEGEMGGSAEEVQGESTSVTVSVSEPNYIINPRSTYRNGISYNVSKQEKASAVIDHIKTVTDYISKERGRLGAIQNRLEYNIESTTNAIENITSSKSCICRSKNRICTD